MTRSSGDSTATLAGAEVTLREDLNALTPRLRRYTRALATCGATASEFADELVHATLMRALGSRTVGTSADLAVRLFATVTQLHREMAVSDRQARAAGVGQPRLVANQTHFPSAARHTKLAVGLMNLPLEEREALLLVGLEGFDHGAAARILRVSRSVLIARLTRARTSMDSHLRAADPASPTRDRSHLRLVT